MWLATVTAKGQMTIPKDVRERLGIKEHDRLLVSVDERGALIVPVRRTTVAQLAGSLASDRPYPGVEAIRAEAGHALGEAALREDTQCPSGPT